MSSIDIPALSFALELSQVLFSLIVMGISSYAAALHTEGLRDPAIETIIYLLLGTSSLAVVIWSYVKVASRFTAAVYARYMHFSLTGLVSLFCMALTTALVVILAKSPNYSGKASSVTWVDAGFSGLSYVIWTMKTLLLGISLSKVEDKSSEIIPVEKVNPAED